MLALNYSQTSSIGPTQRANARQTHGERELFVYLPRLYLLLFY